MSFPILKNPTNEAIMRQTEFNAATIKSLSVPEIRSGENGGETLKRELEQ